MNERDSMTWDREAEAFDQEPDHGLLDAETRTAWRELLTEHLPDEPCDVVDLGCGTGTLSVLLAQSGHRVRGVDFSAEMLTRAAEKARQADVQIELTQADVFDPPLPAGTFDVVMSRHVLWALPDPALVLRRWATLLRPGGRLILVEGHWSTGAGLTAEETEKLLADLGGSISTRPLTDTVYWGRTIADERYLVMSTPAQARS